MFAVLSVCLWRVRVRHCSVLLTTEFDSASAMTCLLRSLQCLAHNGVRLCSVLPTSESDSAVSCSPRSMTLQCLAHGRVGLRGVHEIINFVRVQKRRRNFILLILDQGGFESGKKGKQSCDTLSLLVPINCTESL